MIPRPSNHSYLFKRSQVVSNWISFNANLSQRLGGKLKKHQPSNSPYWHLETSDMHQPWRPSLDYFFSLSHLSLPNLLILAFWFFSFGLQRSVEFWIMMKGMSRAQGCAIRIEVNNDYCLFKWLLVWKTSMPKIRRVNTCGLQRFNERLRYRFLRWKSSPLTLCYTLV